MKRLLDNLVIDLIAAALMVGMAATGYVLRFPRHSIYSGGRYPGIPFAPFHGHRVDRDGQSLHSLTTLALVLTQLVH